MSKGYNNEPFPSKKFQEVIADYLEHEEKKMSTQFENIGGTKICLDERGALGQLYAFDEEENYIALSEELTQDQLRRFVKELLQILDYDTIMTDEELAEYEYEYEHNNT